MRRISLQPLLFQVIITCLSLYVIFVVFFISKSNLNVGVIEGLGFEISRTGYGLIVILITIVISLIIGLPIRLISKVHNWWIHKPIVNILAFLFGLLLIIINSDSFFSRQIISTPTGVLTTYTIANLYCVLAGWFLVAFSLLHYYPGKLLLRTLGQPNT